jgi:chaperonin GroEL
MFVKAPEFGQRQKDIIKDIAVYTGAFLYSSELGCPLPEGLGYYKDKEQGVVHADIALENFGVSPRVIVTQQKTTIVSKENRSKDIEGYLDELRGAIDAEKNSFEEEFKRKRLGMLTSGVGVIRVAAPSELESEDLRLRVDDALSAVKSAIQEGVLPGGGVALLRAVQGISDLRGATDDEQVGIEIVKYAIQRPAWQIATVSGMRGDAVIEKILDAKHKNYGCDVSKKIWGDMMKMGILDPTKAIRCALENSVSVAATFLTTHGTITDIPEVIRPQQ